MYVADHAFSLLSPTDDGVKVETVVYNHCKLLVERGVFDHLSYWRDRTHKVDIILHSSSSVLPIEVKFREDPTRVPGLLVFMKKHKIRRGVVVTKDLFATRTFGHSTIHFVPLWLFLLVV